MKAYPVAYRPGSTGGYQSPGYPSSNPSRYSPPANDNRPPAPVLPFPTSQQTQMPNIPWGKAAITAAKLAAQLAKLHPGLRAALTILDLLQMMFGPFGRWLHDPTTTQIRFCGSGGRGPFQGSGGFTCGNKPIGGGGAVPGIDQATGTYHFLGPHIGFDTLGRSLG